MDPSVLLLESLQRDVQNRVINVINATHKLQELIHEVAKDDSRQFFRQIFPKLLHFIIGHRSSAGLLELCTDSRAAGEVRALLNPHGDLFTAILYLQATDSLTRFEVPLSEFLDDPALTGDKMAKLDYCEFFYFHLTKVVADLPIGPIEVTKPKTVQGSFGGQVYRKFVSLGLGVSFSEKSCRWNHDLVADSYLAILEAHLEFILPIGAGREVNIFTSPIFRSKLIGAAKVGESFASIINQLWFAQSKTSRKLPTLDVLHAAEVTVKHLVSAMCLNPGNNRYMTQTLEGAFSGLRVNLYKFLRTNIEDWPLDNNFIALVQVWRAFVAPWTFMDMGEDLAFWSPYVMNNFCFYLLPLISILEHVEGAIEALVSLQIKTKLILQGEDFVRRLAPSVECLQLVMRTISPIATLLKSVEANELGASTRQISHYSEYKIGEQFAFLEPGMRSIPAVFDSVGVDRAMNLIRWLEKAHSYLQKMGPSQSELTLDGKVLECQDELAHAFEINDQAYAAFVTSQDASEQAECRSNLTPRRRNLIPATPDSKISSLRSISGLKPSYYNDEIPILLTLFSFLTVKINSGLRLGLLKLSSRVPVPQWVFHLAQVDLRFLAVWQNLLFSIVCLTILYILFKLVLI